jgi:hypothetical protein
MPDKDFVSKALDSAKGALASAKKFSGSAGDTDPGRFAPKAAPKTMPVSKPKTDPASLAGEAESAGQGIKNRMENAKQVMPSMKKGGMVKETGPHLLHKGEAVIPAEIMSKATSALGGDKKPKKKLHMSIKPTDDDRFHVTHMYSGGEKTEPMQENTEHAPSSLVELLEHVKKHYGSEMKGASQEKDGPIS